MSKFETVLRKAASKTVAKVSAAAPIAKQIVAAEAELAEARGKYQKAAYQFSLGNLAEAKVDELGADVARLEKRLTHLKAGYDMALAEDAAAVQAQVAELRGARIEELEKRLSARAETAKQFSLDIAAADKSFEAFVRASDAVLSVPGLPIPLELGGMFRAAGVAKLAAFEMLRTHAGGTDGWHLPGAKPDDERHRFDPGKIHPLTAKIEEENAHLLRVIKQTPASVPPAVQPAKAATGGIPIPGEQIDVRGVARPAAVEGTPSGAVELLDPDSLFEEG